jgi:hypothetical protein
MEHRRVTHLGPHSPDGGAKAVRGEHPAVIPRLAYLCKDMWTPDRVSEQQDRQDALRLHINKGE